MSRHPSWRRDGFVISTDPAATDLDMVCGFLADSYWAKGLSREILERSVRAALVYNLIDEATGRQVGFARVVTDHAARGTMLSDGTFGWSGAQGTHFFVDPKEELVGVLMVQTSINEVQREFEDLVAQSIVD